MLYVSLCWLLPVTGKPFLQKQRTSCNYIARQVRSTQHNGAACSRRFTCNHQSNYFGKPPHRGRRVGQYCYIERQTPFRYRGQSTSLQFSQVFHTCTKKNLVYRYKMIPPKVLYVPEGYVSKSARGKYIIYRKKFWYWQQADGLFHLDPTYYQ